MLILLQNDFGLYTETPKWVSVFLKAQSLPLISYISKPSFWKTMEVNEAYVGLSGSPIGSRAWSQASVHWVPMTGTVVSLLPDMLCLASVLQR